MQKKKKKSVIFDFELCLKNKLAQLLKTATVNWEPFLDLNQHFDFKTCKGYSCIYYITAGLL